MYSSQKFHRNQESARAKAEESKSSISANLTRAVGYEDMLRTAFV